MSTSYHIIVYEIIRQMRLVAEIGVIKKDSIEEADEHDAEFEFRGNKMWVNCKAWTDNSSSWHSTYLTRSQDDRASLR